MPDTAERAVEIIRAGCLAPALGITVRTVAGEPYERIIGYQLGPMPEASSADTCSNDGPDDSPF